MTSDRVRYMKHGRRSGIMTEKWLTLAVMVLMVGAPLASAASGEAGTDANPNEADVPFSIDNRTTPSQDGETWGLTVTLDDDAHANGTVLTITTQICLNNGVCDPPVNQEATLSNDGQTYDVSLTPPSDHTYVNWRVKATYDEDNSENFPQGDWYTTWSTCYYDDGSYGGIHAEGDGCNVPGSGSGETEGAMPHVGILGASIALIAVAVGRRHRLQA